MAMREKIAILEGVRTPMGKAGGILKKVPADFLGVCVLKEAMRNSLISPKEVDEVIIGNVAQPANAANIARVIALKAGLGVDVPAYTVHRNCASGMQAITNACESIMCGRAKIVAAGGTESMSNIPLFFNEKMKAFIENLMQANTL